MYKIVYIDTRGHVDSYMAGDPTPGHGANEFASVEIAQAAIPELEAPEVGCRWEVRSQ
jgi:hypothetical protein